MKRVNWRERERERKKTFGDDDRHSLVGVPRAVCVTHKSLNHKKHTIAAKPCLKLSAKAFSSVDSAPSTQTFGHAQKNTPRKDSFFRPWWPFSPLLFLIYFDDVFCLLPSDFFDKKNERKMRIKAKRRKEEKVNFLPWTFWFWRTSEAMKSEKKKTTGKAQKGSKEDTERKEMRDEESRKKERWWADATNVP